ncbi:hypothetical protein SORBI_3002G289350 [Sorghum bicolor]|uniref:Uncharacterized protein n=1 Tax=Sorghum bicolor TaxID=4558 RepID=A0A1W0W647_SORBI|nr:hypothetical protein SORBI_3002G289350 [Sorghum bicolor]
MTISDQSRDQRSKVRPSLAGRQCREECLSRCHSCTCTSLHQQAPAACPCMAASAICLHDWCCLLQVIDDNLGSVIINNCIPCLAVPHTRVVWRW